MAPRRSVSAEAGAAGGLVAGTFDIVYACDFWAVKAGVPMRRIFQSVAAGLLGKASFEGGAATAALGLALHYFIALSMALAYYLVARRWPLLRQRPCSRRRVRAAALRDHELRRSSALGGGRRGSKDPLWVGLSIAVHMFLIGMPIALFAGRAAGSAHTPAGARLTRPALRPPAFLALADPEAPHWG